jgi:Ricin-type beta-trefoil lectin domain
MRKTAWTIGLAAVSVLVLAGLGVSSAGAAAGHATAAAPATGFKIYNAYVTYYGWYDNTPPGCGTAYSGCADGIGTYKDPITFASDKAEFQVGTVIYYPTVEKYFVMGDSCGECTQDWSNPHGGPDSGPGLHHVDLWMGGKGADEFDVIDCEDALTQGKPNGAPLLTRVEVDPPSNLPVSTQSLYNDKTNECFGGMTVSTSHGQYANGRSGECITDPGTAAGTLADVAKCTGAADQDLAFNGAFFMINKLCLNAVSGAGRVGSKLDYAACSGGPNEQWSINGSGTVSTIQFGLCISQSGSSLELAKCTTAAPEKWTFKSEAAPS